MEYRTIDEYLGAIDNIGAEINNLKNESRALWFEMDTLKRHQKEALHKSCFTINEIFPMQTLNFIKRINAAGELTLKPARYWGYWEQRDLQDNLVMVWQGPCFGPLQKYPESIKRRFVDFKINDKHQESSVATTLYNYEKEIARDWREGAPVIDTGDEITEALSNKTAEVYEFIDNLSARERRYMREGKSRKVRGLREMMIKAGLQPDPGGE